VDPNTSLRKTVNDVAEVLVSGELKRVKGEDAQNLFFEVVAVAFKRQIPLVSAKGHFDLFGDSFNTHESESDDRDDRNNCPSHLVDEGQRQGEQIQGDTLLQVNTI
jgi:hypothetical protein